MPPVVSKAKDLEPGDLHPSLEVKVAKTYLVVSTDPMTALLERYSTWGRLKRGVAWILRYKKFLLARSKGNSYEMSKVLSVRDLREAEREIILLVQRNVFPNKITVTMRSEGH